MIEGIIIGILICTTAYLIKMNVELTHKLKNTPKKEKKELTKAQKDKIEKINESFEQLMSYDYKIALRSDK